MGLGARDLLDKSRDNKPSFEDIWKRGTVGYHVRGSPLKEADTEQPPVRRQTSRDAGPKSRL